MTELSAVSGPDGTDASGRFEGLSGAFWTTPDATIPVSGRYTRVSGGYNEGENGFQFF